AWPAAANCVSLTVKSIGKPDARNGHVRFDERRRETGRRFGVSTRARPRLYNTHLLPISEKLSFSDSWSRRGSTDAEQVNDWREFDRCYSHSPGHRSRLFLNRIGFPRTVPSGQDSAELPAAWQTPPRSLVVAFRSRHQARTPGCGLPGPTLDTGV